MVCFGFQDGYGGYSNSYEGGYGGGGGGGGGARGGRGKGTLTTIFNLKFC